MQHESYEGDSMSDIDTTNKVLSFVCGYFDRNKHIPKLIGNLVNNYILANPESGILLIEWLETNRYELLQALIQLEENTEDLQAEDSDPAGDHPGRTHPVLQHVEPVDNMIYPETMFR